MRALPALALCLVAAQLHAGAAHRYSEISVADVEEGPAVTSATGLAAAGADPQEAERASRSINRMRSGVRRSASRVEEAAEGAEAAQEAAEKAAANSTTSDVVWKLAEDAKQAQARLQEAKAKHEVAVKAAEAKEEALLDDVAGSSIMANAARMLQRLVAEETPLADLEPALVTVASLIEAEQRDEAREQERDQEVCSSAIDSAHHKLQSTRRDIAAAKEIVAQRKAVVEEAHDAMKQHGADIEAVKATIAANEEQQARIRTGIREEVDGAKERAKDHASVSKAVHELVGNMDNSLSTDSTKSTDMRFARKRSTVGSSAGAALEPAGDWTSAVEWLQTAEESGAPACPAGTFFKEGEGEGERDSCAPCPPGTYNNVQGAVGRDSCAVCQKDTYQPLESAAACIACPVGQHTEGTGAITAQACQGRKEREEAVELKTPEERSAAEADAAEMDGFERMVQAKRNAMDMKDLVHQLEGGVASSAPHRPDTRTLEHLLAASRREHKTLTAEHAMLERQMLERRARVVSSEGFLTQARHHVTQLEELASHQAAFLHHTESPCKSRKNHYEAATAHRVFALHIVGQMGAAVRAFHAQPEGQPGAAKALMKQLKDIEGQLQHPPQTPAQQREAAQEELAQVRRQRQHALAMEREQARKELCVYTSQRGDNLAAIAEKFGQSADAIERANEGTSLPRAARDTAKAFYPATGTRIVVPRRGMDHTARRLCRWVPPTGLVHLVLHDTLTHMRKVCWKVEDPERALHEEEQELFGKDGIFDPEPVRPAMTGITGPAKSEEEVAQEKKQQKEKERKEEGPVAEEEARKPEPQPVPATPVAAATGSVQSSGLPADAAGYTEEGLAFDCDRFALADMGHSGAQQLAASLRDAEGVTVEAWVYVLQEEVDGRRFTPLVSMVGESATNPISHVVDGLGPYRTGLLLGYGPRRHVRSPAEAPLFSFGVKAAEGDVLMTEVQGVEVQPRRWYHVAATYDGKRQALYVDGRLAASAAAQRGPLRFGWDGDHPSHVSDETRLHLLAGGLDSACQRTALSHVSVWRKAVSEDALAAHARSPAATARATQEGLRAGGLRRGARQVVAYYPLTSAFEQEGNERAVEDRGPLSLHGAVETGEGVSMERRAVEEEAAKEGGASIGDAGPSGVFVSSATGVTGSPGARQLGATGAFEVDSADFARRRREASLRVAEAQAAARKYAEQLVGTSEEVKREVQPLKMLAEELDAVTTKVEAAEQNLKHARLTVEDAEMEEDKAAAAAGGKRVQEAEAELAELKERRTQLENEIVGRHEKVVDLRKEGAAFGLKEEAARAAHKRAVAELNRVLAERRAVSARSRAAALDAAFSRSSARVRSYGQALKQARRQGDDAKEKRLLAVGQDASERAAELLHASEKARAEAEAAQAASATGAAGSSSGFVEQDQRAAA